MDSGQGPWHSVNSGIYHDNPDCQTGNSIAPENVRHGTGDGRLCDECARLNAAAASPRPPRAPAPPPRPRPPRAPDARARPAARAGPPGPPAAAPTGAPHGGGREGGTPPPATAATAGS